MAAWAVERHGPVAIALYSAPPRNFMTFAGMTELGEVVEEVAKNDSVTVLVIASAVPGYFVSHGDLEDLTRMGRGEPVEGDPGSWPRVLARLVSMPQIVIAAIDGQAWGGGLEMALACTLRVAGPNAHFAFCELALGLIPGGGGTQRLPRLIGAGRAAELILSGRVVRADEALRLGIVEHGVDGGDFLTEALRWIEPWAVKPQAALRSAKRAITDGLDLALDEGLLLEQSLVRPLLGSMESQRLQEEALARYRRTTDGQVAYL